MCLHTYLFLLCIKYKVANDLLAYSDQYEIFTLCNLLYKKFLVFRIVSLISYSLHISMKEGRRHFTEGEDKLPAKSSLWHILGFSIYYFLI